MARIVLFHHALGLTQGVLDFAERLRERGHEVYTPDLFEEQVFATPDAGLDYVRSIGFGTVVTRGTDAVATLPDDVVYGGFSLGVMPAQSLAQQRPGAKGALLFHGCAGPTAFGAEWPLNVPVQIHAMEDDPWFVGEDRAAAQSFVDNVPGAELFLYPGSGHLFAEAESADYDADATALMTERVLGFLAKL